MFKYNDEARVITLADGSAVGPFKATAYKTAICPLVGGLVAQGKSPAEIRTFLALMPDSLDVEGKRIAEVEALATEASKLLTPKHAEQARGLLGNADLADEAFDTAKATFDAAFAKWEASESGMKVAKAREAARLAQAAFEAAETEAKAGGDWKAVSGLQTAMSLKASEAEKAKTELSALRRVIVGESARFDPLVLTLDDNGKVTFAASGKRKARRVIRTPGETNGKGQSLTVDGKTYESAAAALVACDPEYVREKGKNFSRANIVARLSKAHKVG